ncbi:MAG: hypothetical protein ACD_15C00137G0026 [uncultured bacterium]|nr:MAG: hypothetical protein ACD_15C00137G0026 [uncultured bacterium]
MNKNIKIIILALVLLVLVGGVYTLGEYRGKYNSQSISEQKLENLQQSIDKLNKTNSIPKMEDKKADINSSAGIQSIIQSSTEKINQEGQVKCQQELSEYNSCLAEYNSKMAEYNSCLTESTDPNSWRYKSYCSKPSNYCFKPSCTY